MDSSSDKDSYMYSYDTFPYINDQKNYPMKVFISHSHKDSFIAQTISDKIKARGVDTFLDLNDMDFGQDARMRVKEAMRECDDLLILITPSALNSGWILYEIGLADGADKRVIPVLSGLAKNESFEVLGNIVTIDLNSIDQYIDNLNP